MTLISMTLCILFLQNTSGLESDGQRITLETCLQMALEQDPNIHLSKQDVRLSQARQEVSEGRYDLQIAADVVTTRRKSPQVGGDATSETQTLQTTLSRKLRSGLVLEGEMGLNRSELDEMGALLENRASIDMGVTYPLLKGRGRMVTTADEQAAQLEYEATLQDLRHTVSITVLQVAQAYWDYREAMETLSILERGERYNAKLVEETKRLIEADELPANELLQLRANLANKRAQVVSATTRLETARQELGQVMGIQAEEILSLPLPGDNYLEWSDLKPPPEAMNHAYIARAHEDRADSRALQLRGKALEMDVLSRRDGLKAELDASIEAGYESLELGSGLQALGRSFYQNARGLNYTASLSYRFAMGNRTARGQFTQAHASRTRNTIQFEDLQRTIASRILFTLQALRRNYSELDAYRESIRYYELALTNEQKKLRLGFSTLIDVISYEDRLTSAQLGYISGQTTFHKSLLQLHFETGTILEKGEEKDFLNFVRLQSWPL